MTERYLYTDKIGAGPEHPKKRWGLFSTEITPERAAARYGLDAAERGEWFGIVLLEPRLERPRAFLQMCPRANGVELNKLSAHGSVEAAYTWGAYSDPPGPQPFNHTPDSVFLGGVTWYVYPEEDRFFRRDQSVGTVNMEFGPDGYAKEEQVTRHGFGQPSEVETREFHGVDVSANWVRIPAFGDWEAFFHPEPSG